MSELRKQHVDSIKLIEEMSKLRAEASKKMPGNVELWDKIHKDNLESTQQDISDWQQARLIALDIDVPDWTDLIRVYDDVVVDSFITGITEIIKDKVKATEFKICDKDGNINEEKQEIFEQEWFFKFLDYCTESFFYPYSLIQLGDMTDGKFADIKNFKREYVVKQKDFVKQNIYSLGAYQNGIDGWWLEDPKYNPYYILVKSDIELGLFDRIASHALGKKHLLISLWKYGELFGSPTRVGKTDIDDPGRRRNMEAMLSNMGSNLWASMHTDDELMFIEGKAGSGNSVFIDAMNYSNSEISKALIGGEGVMSEKSFVGSSEIGERMFEIKGKSYLRKIKFICNNDLIPRMQKYGLNMNGLYFKWINEDKISYDQKIEAVKVLVPNFKLDPEEVGEKLGFTLEAKEDPQQATVEAIKAIKSKSNMTELSAMYSDSKLLTVNSSETKKEFTKRFMADKEMVSMYPITSSRMSACNSQYKLCRNGR